MSDTWISLTQGKWTVIDDTDLPLVSGYKWHARADGNTYYAETNTYREGVRKVVKMHNLIQQPETGMVCDHWDGDGLNNRQSNLRSCTQQQNLQNRAPKSGRRYKGTFLNKGRYQARIRLDGKDINLGRHDTEKEAALAYNTAALRIFGEFARLNEVQDD